MYKHGHDFVERVDYFNFVQPQDLFCKVLAVDSDFHNWIWNITVVLKSCRGFATAGNCHSLCALRQNEEALICSAQWMVRQMAGLHFSIWAQRFRAGRQHVVPAHLARTCVNLIESFLCIPPDWVIRPTCCGKPVGELGIV